MAVPIYCPRGSPSLLNGDFYENVARLKDFSWSVIFSSPPVTNGSASGNMKDSGDSMKAELMEILYSLPISAMIFLFAVLLACFVHQLVSCVRATGKMTVYVGVCAFSSVMFFYVWLILWRTDPENLIFVNSAILMVLIMFGGGPVYKKCLDVIPSYEEVEKLNPIPLRLFFALVGILVFLFLPPSPPESMGCPPLRARLIGEGLFWFMVYHLITVYMTFEVMVLILIAQEFDIRENGVYIGKYVKKGEFGWIIQYREKEKSEALIP